MPTPKHENNHDYAAPIIATLKYWRDYDGKGDEYRAAHDRDALQMGGDLNADTIISLWLPLRYTMNRFDMTTWQKWKDFEYDTLRPKGLGLKDYPAFLDDMMGKINQFLDMEDELTQKLLTLFSLGQERTNVMLLPKRSWNSRRGCRPYWDYLPHFLFDLFTYSVDEDALRRWLQAESLEPFFAKETFTQENILDLAGTGSPCRHNPREIDLERLLDNYIAILRRRAELLALRAA